jgi:hypothetical protein
MSIPGKAVFLSYAREDSAHMRRIAGALRTTGVEVWFDEDELRGGDGGIRKSGGKSGNARCSCRSSRRVPRHALLRLCCLCGLLCNAWIILADVINAFAQLLP